MIRAFQLLIGVWLLLPLASTVAAAQTHASSPVLPPSANISPPGEDAASSSAECPMEASLVSMSEELDGLLLEGNAGTQERRVSLYRCILRHAGSSGTDEEQAVIHRHVAQMSMLMTDPAFENLLETGRKDRPAEWAFKEDAGEMLIRWWRANDPVPTTPLNERLREHLERLSVARMQYGTTEFTSGIDARGQTYVRFGPPESVDAVDFRHQMDVDQTFSSDFPDNEIWAYPSLSRIGTYIFYEEDDTYYLGESSDLIPRRLRNGTMSSTRRGQERAISALEVMEFVYRRLAYHQDHIGFAYIDAFKYIDRYETLNRAQAMGANMSLQTMAGGPEPPQVAASRTLTEARTADRQMARQRKKQMPKQASTFLSGPDLPVDYRITRFLDEDGTPVATIDWMVVDNGFELDPSLEQAYRNSTVDNYPDRVVELAAVRQDDDYQTEHTASRVYAFDLSRDTQGHAQSLVIPLRAQQVANLALQWTGQLGRIGSEKVVYGPRFAYSVERADPISGLDASKRVLLMSDLRPLTPPSSDPGGASALEQAKPYAASTIRPKDDLLLYFEVYNLRFSEREETNYSIQYEVEVDSDSGPFGLFSREKRISSTVAEYQGISSRAEEYIQIDLAELDLEDDDRIRVRVTTVDQVSGEETARTLAFDVTEREE